MRKLSCWESSDEGWGHLKFLMARVVKTTSNDRARVYIQPVYSTYIFNLHGDFHRTLFGAIFVLSLFRERKVALCGHF